MNSTPQAQNQQYQQYQGQPSAPQQRPNYQPKKPMSADLKKLFTLFTLVASFLSFGFFFMPVAKDMSGIVLFSTDSSLLAGFAYLCLLGGITCAVLTQVLKQRMLHIATISALGASLLFLFIAVVSCTDLGIGFLFYFLSTATAITFSSLLLASK